MTPRKRIALDDHIRRWFASGATYGPSYRTKDREVLGIPWMFESRITPGHYYEGLLFESDDDLHRSGFAGHEVGR